MGNGRGTAVLVGKVTLEGNAVLTQNANVILECGATEPRAHAYSDTKGNFSIAVTVTDSGLASTIPNRLNTSISKQEWANCELYADLPGYTSEHLRLFEKPGEGVLEVGNVVLHPVSQDHSFSVSVTSLAAPDKAKAAFEKGQEQENKGKWAAAMECFKKAIAVYPKYALAWLELGRAQVKQNAFTDARESFHQSIIQDSKLLGGYDELADLALQQQQWKELADTTDRLVQFAPDFAQYWFLNSAANFNLGNMTKAESSIARGLPLDPKHTLPQMEYLYGLILANKHDYASASEHVGTYLRLAPHAKDAQSAQNSLAEFQKQLQLADK